MQDQASIGVSVAGKIQMPRDVSVEGPITENPAIVSMHKGEYLAGARAALT